MKLFASVLFALLLFGAGQAQAQRVIEIGPRAGIDIDALNDPFIGLDVRVSTVSLPVVINPTFDYYLTEGDVNFYQLSGNALYEFGIDNQVFTPYSGLGLGISRASFDGEGNTDFGLNVIGGAAFRVGALKPFVQAQLTLLGDADLTTLGGGVLFRLGQ